MMSKSVNLDFSTILKGESDFQLIGFDEIVAENGLVVFGKYDRAAVQTAINKGNRVLIRFPADCHDTCDQGINLGKILNIEDIDLLRNPQVSVICTDHHRNIHSALCDHKDDSQLILKASYGNIRMAVILLMRDRKRVDHVHKELILKLPHLEISEAVDALTPYAIDNFVRANQTPIMKPIKAGQIGCIFSHLKLWKNLLNSRHPAVMVLEDDTLLCDDFQGRITQALDEVPPTFDILHLYIAGGGEDDNEEVLRSRVAMEDTSAYVISRRGARKLVNYLRRIGIRETLGSMFVKMTEKGELESYAVNKSIFDNVGQKTCSQDLSDGNVLESNTCNSRIYVPEN